MSDVLLKIIHFAADFYMQCMFFFFECYLLLLKIKIIKKIVKKLTVKYKSR